MPDTPKYSTRRVNAEGPEDANIYIVGSVPGREDNQVLRPFAGTDGRLLNSFLQQSGMHRNACRVSNVCRYRPSRNKFNALPDELVAEELRELKDDIRRTNPNLVILLGEIPLVHVQGLHRITKWRGSVLWNMELGCKVMATIHPGEIRKQWDYFPQVLGDLQKAQKEATFHELRRLQRNIKVNPSFPEVLTALTFLSTQEKLSFDIETTRGECYITSIAFAWSATDSFVIPFTYSVSVDIVANRWTEEQEEEIWLGIAALLQTGKIKKIAQNAQFDMGVIERRIGIHTCNLWVDTMCLFHCIYPELPKSLDFLASLYTDHPFYSDWSSQGMSSSGSTTEQMQC